MNLTNPKIMKHTHNFKTAIAMIFAIATLCFAFPANAQTTHTWDGSGSTLTTLSDGDTVVIATGAQDTLTVPAGAEITITSIGAVDNENRQITLDIAPTATVTWEADYTMSVATGTIHVVTITGGGDFVVADGQIISRSTASGGSVIRVADGSVTVTGGLVSATGFGTIVMVNGILTLATNTGNIRVEGGEVSTFAAAPAIILNGGASQNNISVTVTGGVVRSMGHRAIRGRIVTISGGLVLGAQPRTAANLPVPLTDVISTAGTPAADPVNSLSITGDGIVVAWHGWLGNLLTPSQRVVGMNTSANLFAFNDADDATATWAVVNGAHGFVNNRNSIFVEVPGIAVVEAWDSDTPPIVADGETIIIASGAEGILEVPANAEVIIAGAGTVDNANRQITLNIGAGAKVIWEANYTSSMNNAVTLTGGGELVVSGSIVSTSTALSGGAIQVQNGSITVLGGVVSAIGTAGQVHGIWSTTTNIAGHITVDGGLVSSAGAPGGGGTAIFLHANSTAVHVTVKNGGIVRAATARAMRADTVNVVDGFIFGANRRGVATLPLTADTTDVVSAATGLASNTPASLNITGDGIVIAWHQRGNSDQTVFTRDSETNLLALHNDGDARAWWNIVSDTVFGISNNKNTIFLEIPGITVEMPVNLTSVWDSDLPPTITGDAEITIAAGATGTLVVPADLEVTIISQGKVDNDDLAITLNIAAGATVIWEAEYTSSTQNTVTITGGGAFVVSDGAIINTFNTMVFLVAHAVILAENGSVTITGGLVSATGTDAITVNGILSTATNAGNITVEGGMINTQTQPAINTVATSGSAITIKGGTVRTNSHRAIRATTVTIEGGVVFSGGAVTNSFANVISASGGNNPPANLTIAEEGIAVLWTPGTLREFQRGRNTNLHVFHDDENAEAWWDYVVVGQDTTFGIANNKNATFIEIPDVTVVTPTFEITFSVMHALGGTLAARIEGAENNMTSGTEVEEGVTVVFTATPNTYFRVREWRHNGEVVENNTTNTFTLENITANATVTVEFEADPDQTSLAGIAEQASLHVHPNPFIDQITIIDAEGGVLNILNMNGAVVHTQRIANANETIHLGHLPRGVYILQVGNLVTRIVKQ